MMILDLNCQRACMKGNQIHVDLFKNRKIRADEKGLEYQHIQMYYYSNQINAAMKDSRQVCKRNERMCTTAQEKLVRSFIINRGVRGKWKKEKVKASECGIAAG